MNRAQRRAAGMVRAKNALPPVKPGRNPPWGPWVPGELPEVTDAMIAARAAHTGVTPAEVREVIDTMRLTERIVVNAVYQVNIREAGEGAPFGRVLHLSLKRRDKLPLGPERFRDLQRIKNELCGPECEAVEIYPAESRLVDTSNQYHLWVFVDGYRLPFGFGERLVIGHSGAGAVQQPFAEDAA